MTIEDYKEYGDNYVGYIDEATMVSTRSEADELIIRDMCTSVAVGDTVYFRCGAFTKGLGTRCGVSMFEKVWWKWFGGNMLTAAQLSELIAENTPEEDV